MLIQENSSYPVSMSRHESVTEEFIAELKAGFEREAERVKAAQPGPTPKWESLLVHIRIWLPWAVRNKVGLATKSIVNSGSERHSGKCQTRCMLSETDR